MDPSRSRRRTRRTRLPRTRGDGPVASQSVSEVPGASPHTRGWTPRRVLQPRRVGGFPRTRGDGPAHRPTMPAADGASPHTRGWTRDSQHPRVNLRGFPAHAGMDRWPGVERPGHPWLPRTRGDGPCPAPATHIMYLASPHTRGWTPRQIVSVEADHGFPAHAGMDPSTMPRRTGRRRLPRTRGDGPLIEHFGRREFQASPHTRGWTPDPRVERMGCGGFPAHAGMDPRTPNPRKSPRRLPRTRGDGPVIEKCGEWQIEASPHTRGWTPCSRGTGTSESGFPAHAGMDPPSTSRRRPIGGLPRTRGDGPALPRLRPAHRRLPRTRGDGPPSGVALVGIHRASPHTRGWTLRARHNRVLHEGFPAHAGMELLAVIERTPAERETVAWRKSLTENGL